MSVKFGHCRLCPKGSPTKRLYADDICAYHLNHQGHDQSEEVAEISPAVVHRDKLLKKFYEDGWKVMPNYCENNCGVKLRPPNLAKAKFFICHIIPKKHFESVMVHPDNRLFMCWQCHHDYDSSWQKAVQMPVWPLAIERFRAFMALIKDTELRHLPDALRLIHDAPC